MRTDQNCLNDPATALDRTFRLMRDELSDKVQDRDLLDSLTGTEIALAADAANLKSHACQTAFVTAALLLARSGHTVYLLAPDVPLLGKQPPLSKDSLLSALIDVGRDLIPGLEFRMGPPTHAIDAAVLFGGSEWRGKRSRRVPRREHGLARLDFARPRGEPMALRWLAHWSSRCSRSCRKRGIQGSHAQTTPVCYSS